MNSMQKILYLASTSQSRQMLLKEALIPFIVIGHSADEDAVDRSLSFKDLILEIARKKMDHAQLPLGKEGQEIIVLSADSMGYDVQGIVHGKPKNKEDALAKIRSLSEKNSTTATAFCLDKKCWKSDRWVRVDRKECVVESRYRFVVPEKWITRYLDHSWAMIASGAIAVELYGAQFLKSVEGSYSSIVGLPMFELREALGDFDFF